MDYFDRFSVLFSEGNVRLGRNTIFPLGQITTDYLNLDPQVLREIESHVISFAAEARILIKEKYSGNVIPVQEELNAACSLIFNLPFFSDLPLDEHEIRNMFPVLFANKKGWNAATEKGTREHRTLMVFIDKMEYFPESLRNFRAQIIGMLELYFEDLPRRNSTEYAKAYLAYFLDMQKGGSMIFPDRSFEQAFETRSKFIPLHLHTEEAGIVLAEVSEFSYLSHFLYTDFYRGLIAGNCPRRCHNCGQYFLLTGGYDTCYCNNTAPGETAKTCRKVGAHRKAKELTSTSPMLHEYQKVYNRLKTRKNRGRISSSEWNAAVAIVQDYREQAEAGKISEAELKEIYDKM